MSEPRCLKWRRSRRKQVHAGDFIRWPPTVNEKNTKEIENKSQGTRLAHGSPQRPPCRASCKNARFFSEESERKSGGGPPTAGRVCPRLRELPWDGRVAALRAARVKQCPAALAAGRAQGFFGTRRSRIRALSAAEQAALAAILAASNSTAACHDRSGAGRVGHRCRTYTGGAATRHSSRRRSGRSTEPASLPRESQAYLQPGERWRACRHGVVVSRRAATVGPSASIHLGSLIIQITEEQSIQP